jgi:FlaA1/EpsC-like NDP-sugar epimerase
MIAKIFEHGWNRIDMQHKHVLVTGGAGFIGSNLANTLSANN